MQSEDAIQRCQHGRTTLVWMDTILSNEVRLCTGDMWRDGRLKWPEAFPRYQRGTREYKQERRGHYGLRYIVLLDPTQPAECECACGCATVAAFGGFSVDHGVLRCAACVDAGHPPVGRWPALG